MIFQEPMTALNSVFKIKNQLIESILVHKKKSKKDQKAFRQQLDEKRFVVK